MAVGSIYKRHEFCTPDGSVVAAPDNSLKMLIRNSALRLSFNDSGGGSNYLVLTTSRDLRAASVIKRVPTLVSASVGCDWKFIYCMRRYGNSQENCNFML